jgi:hypothetical protein
LSARMDGIALRWSLSLPRGVLGFGLVLLGGRGVSVILWAACAVLLLPRAAELQKMRWARARCADRWAPPAGRLSSRTSAGP